MPRLADPLRSTSASAPRPWLRLAASAGLAASCLLLPIDAGSVRAGDDAGVRDFLMSEARRSAPPAAQAAPTAASLQAAPAMFQRALAMQSPFPPRHRDGETRAARAKPAAPRAEFASLHRPEEATKPKQSDTERGLGGRAVSLILQDETLRPGDIVVFPDGPKVFTGGPGRHKRSDFEDVQRSTAIAKDVRKAVLALTSPAANPAHEARRRVAAKGAAAPLPSGPLEASASAADIRVVYPSALRSR
jgi:hypothetical protein